LTTGGSEFQIGALVHVGTAAELRGMADKLNQMAEQLDPGGRDEMGSPLIADHGSAERWLPQLAAIAQSEYRKRRVRTRYLAPELLGEPAWDILLDLLVQQARGRQISVTSACLGSGVPCTTALRWIAALESQGLVTRVAARHDKRVVFLELTQRALEALNRSLTGAAEPGH
jgi:DNA-binding MarR family transcriptional regulator